MQQQGWLESPDVIFNKVQQASFTLANMSEQPCLKSKQNFT